MIGLLSYLPWSVCYSTGYSIDSIDYATPFDSSQYFVQAINFDDDRGLVWFDHNYCSNNSSNFLASAWQTNCLIIVLYLLLLLYGMKSTLFWDY